MRGADDRSVGMFSYVRLEDRITADHPLRSIRALVEEVLEHLSVRFSELYSHTGRPSIPPEQLLKATLLQAFFSIRSERQLTEQMDYNLLFRWFVGLELDDRIWDASTFSKNRDRLLEADVARVPGDVDGAWAGQAPAVDRSLLGRWYGLVTDLRRSPERLELARGDRRYDQAFRRVQAGGGAYCADQWLAA